MAHSVLSLLYTVIVLTFFLSEIIFDFLLTLDKKQVAVP